MERNQPDISDRADNLQQFIPEDGQAWKNWDFSSPLFEHFFIIGPESWKETAESTILYEYPDLGIKNDYQISPFLFVNGHQWAKDEFSSFEEMSFHTTRVNAISDKILLIRTDGGNPVFLYSLVFRASPLTRPALIDFHYINDMLKCRDQKKIVSCLFAFVFVSRHPFYELLFNCLERILQLEARTRSSLKNLDVLRACNTPLSPSLDPLEIWPATTYNARKKILKAMYECYLPAFGEEIGFDSELFSPLKWKMPYPRDIPTVLAKLGYRPLFEWIQVNDFEKLLECAFLEHNIIVVGDRISDVVRTVVFIPQLLSPFTWMYPIITILPESLIDLLDSPIASIVGISSHYEVVRNPEDVWIDLDTCTIQFPDNLPYFPSHEEFSAIFSPVFESSIDKIEINIQLIVSMIAEFIERTFTQPMVKSLKSSRIQFGIGSMLDVNIFKNNFSDEEQDFLTQFMSTQIFISFKEQLCRLNSESLESEDLATKLMTMGEWAVKLSREIKATSEFSCPDGLSEADIGAINHFNHY